ncbi:DsbA family protein [Janthinobacterium sp. HLX7-2]|uniref:DsbA family protein n=1 Tax=Janthinobacterium sp. HLX7-2 TaxID=1259331 RepID=UPI003F26C431
MPTLHYIFDPLCGWCYGAAPLVEAARAVAGLAVAFHGGGMMTGSNRRQITPAWRGYVLPHDRRIEQLSGQPFGDAYLHGLLNDTTAMMDSEPPITAILAAEALAGKGLDMLQRVQRAHYVEGLRIAELPVLVALAQQLGMDGAAFEAAYAQQAGAATQQHIAASRALLAQVAGQGFPTFVFDDGSGKLAVIDIGAFLGQPDKLQAQLAGACGAQGCVL